MKVAAKTNHIGSRVAMMSKAILSLLSFVFLMCQSSLAAKADGGKRFFMLMDDGGEHPVCECSQKGTLPKKLMKAKELSKQEGYVGSLQTEFADKNEAGIDSFEHYFSTRVACERALKKQMSVQGYVEVCASTKPTPSGSPNI
jgi:hypothetical protein